jgi:signal peptidase II
VRRVPVHRLKASATPFYVGGSVVLADTAVTAWATHALAHRRVHVAGPIWLQLSANRGVSFSLAHEWPFVATVATLGVLVVVVGVSLFARAGWPATGFGLLVGGGVGNVVDRLASRPPAVTDYVAVGSFPSFNVADAAITVGVVILFIVALRGQTLLRSR